MRPMTGRGCKPSGFAVTQVAVKLYVTVAARVIVPKHNRKKTLRIGISGFQQETERLTREILGADNRKLFNS